MSSRKVPAVGPVPGQLPLLKVEDLVGLRDPDAASAGRAQGPVVRHVHVLTYQPDRGDSVSIAFTKAADAVAVQAALPLGTVNGLAVRVFSTFDEWSAARGTDWQE